jgi:pimeloyl-ACP methyl ester carboxylesterase
MHSPQSPRRVHVDSPLELVLVHGTWADADSFARATACFTEVLEPQSVRSFKWSGRNRVRDREDASASFVDYLRQLDAGSPGWRRIAVCHSHGGTVAMQAIARLPDALPLDALVCIGTPFLHVHRRVDVEPGTKPPLKLLHSLPAFIVACGLVLAIATGWPEVFAQAVWSAVDAPATWLLALIVEHPFASLLTTVVGLGVLGLALLVSVFFYVFYYLPVKKDWDPFGLLDQSYEYRDELLDGAKDDIADLIARTRLPTAMTIPTLLLKLPGDEAHGWLTAASMAHWTMNSLYGAPIRSAQALTRSCRELGSWAQPATLLVALFAGWLRWLLSLPTLLIAALFTMPFGVEFCKAAGRLAVYPGDTPPGRWQVHYYPLFDREDERRRSRQAYLDAEVDFFDDGLDALEEQLLDRWIESTRGIVHSRAYADPRVASLVADWFCTLNVRQDA